MDNRHLAGVRNAPRESRRLRRRMMRLCLRQSGRPRLLLPRGRAAARGPRPYSAPIRRLGPVAVSQNEHKGAEEERRNYQYILFFFMIRLDE